MTIFKPCAGAIEIARTCEGGPSEFVLISVGAGFPARDLDGIVTGISLNLSSNVQFLHSLDDLIYAYAFGDRIGDLSVGGIGFVNPCGSGSTSRMDIFNIYPFYENNRPIGADVKVLNITLSSAQTSINLRGVLMAMRIDVTEENGTMGYWTLSFKVIRQ